MHPTLSDLASTAHAADLRAAGVLWAEPSRRGAYVAAPRLAERLSAMVQRFTGWAERPHAGSSARVCCLA
jgi:hypothetical protein